MNREAKPLGNTANRRIWEDSFTFWAQPPSASEQERCKHAENVIREVIKKSAVLREKSIRVFTQGSYRNNTNERRQSDVDIGVMCTDVCFTDFTFAPDVTAEMMGHGDHPYTFAKFKNDVENALKTLGSEGVTRSNKAFDVHENSYRVDADVVACFEHIRYVRDASGIVVPEYGTQFIADDGTIVVNWPDHHYENGVAKNDRTAKKFKPIVRILKSLRTEMRDNEIEGADVPSFLVECLVYNIPDPLLCAGSTWKERVETVLVVAHDQIKKNHHTEWGEVSERKYLFRGIQPWSPETATKFIESALNYLGF